MSELYDILVETPPTKVILLALDQGLWDCERSLAELSALCEANHMEAVAQVTQKRQTPETGIVLGSGKLEEASLAAETLGAECAVFDGELTGSQIRNISNALGGLEVIDRTMLILEIFRSRAVTNEGKLQTELALLRYRLPRNLVEAFKSTLEEAAWSDVIIRVADAGDEQREEQLAVTDEVLDGLDCADIPRLTIYNKCDKPGAMSFDPDILLTSAKTGYGLDTLLAKLDEVLSDRVHTLKVLLPYDKLGLAAPMRERGSVQVEEYREDGLYLEGIVKTEDLHCFEGYLV